MKPIFSYYPEENKFEGQEINLVLSLSYKHLSCLVYAQQNKNVLEISEYNFSENNIERFSFLTNQIISELTKKYKSFGLVKIIKSTEIFSLVPSNKYSNEELTKLLQFTHGRDVKPEQKIDTFEHIIGSDKVQLLLQADSFSNYTSNHIFLNNQTYYDTQLFFENIVNKFFDNDATYINVREDSFEIIIVKNKSLLLFNRFNFKTANDFCYFAIGAINASEVNPLKSKVFLCGNVMQQSEIFKTLNRYVFELEFLKAENQFITDESLKHIYFNQLSIL